jgi:glucose/arabinose dehydrogenase
MTIKPLTSGAAAAFVLAGMIATFSAVTYRGASGQAADTKDALAQNFAIEHEIGRRFHIDPNDLPPPYTAPIVADRSLTLPYQGQAPQVPPGFTATLFASGLTNPRRLLVLPNGDVLLAEQGPGYLTIMRDDGEGGPAKWIDRFADGFDKPYGMALRGDELLLADQDGIWRVPLVVGALRAGRPVPPQPAADVPPDQRKPVPGAYGAEMLTQRGVFGVVAGHQNRHLVIDPRSGALYVGVGSVGNVGVEPEPKATIQRFDPDGSNQSTVVTGTRNPTALAFHPDTGELWAVVQERDGMGDNLPSDYLIRVQPGGFYGWPYAYIGKHPMPGFAQLAPEKVEATIMPDLLFTAHSSLLDLVFYEGDQFPAEYKGSLFVALKGSWNRSVPTGYKIVRVPFKDGRPEGWYENFATGFWASGDERAEVWGRPTALAVAKDGSLLVADDTGGTIWRISYKGPPPAEHAAAPAR